MMEKHTNALINETSLYLLQHAHNPVNWLPWSEEVFIQAREENKLVLVSVGYSACHWCHVMERECFENEEVAKLMNEHFICVKVDREEHPDVDQVYMTAVQLMTQRGGWPLNCFTLPDGRPVYGGTYFPKEQWMHILRSLVHTYTNEPEKVLTYAENLHEGIVKSELIEVKATGIEMQNEKLHELVLRWSRNFDRVEGGENRAPKFPLPSNYQFLLSYGVQYENYPVLNHVELTLDKMAMGGIYDQAGGGFSRYSVDVLWKVPHFEKMLYDNGQLIGLYANAYKQFKKPLYKRIVYQTIEWLNREMTAPFGACYSALDADSEGEEGKFYCWTKKEFESLVGEKFPWAIDFYSINQKGYWEEEKYILLRKENDKVFAGKMGWSMDKLEEEINQLNACLLDERSHRVRPVRDEKCLTSWNAMTITGLCTAYEAFGEDEFKQKALRIGKWTVNTQWKDRANLMRNFAGGSSKISGFLDDYAFTIEAFVHLFLITGDEQWAINAKDLLLQAIDRFQDDKSLMFYYTEKDNSLIARKMELNDNVLPSGNSVMCGNLISLSIIFETQNWYKMAVQMLQNIYEGMEFYGSGYSNWSEHLMKDVNDYYHVFISGKSCMDELKELRSQFIPQAFFVPGINDELPCFKQKYTTELNFQVCKDHVCLLPTQERQDVLEFIMKGGNVNE